MGRRAKRRAAVEEGAESDPDAVAAVRIEWLRDLAAVQAQERLDRTRGGHQPTLVRQADGVQVAAYGDDSGPVIRPDLADGDRRVHAGGQVRKVARVSDLMGWLLRRGRISFAQARAGRRFRNSFEMAHLGGIRAADLSTMLGGAGGRGTSAEMDDTLGVVEISKREVWDAMAMLGHGSPAASLVWHVVGNGMSIQDWAFSGGWPMHRTTAGHMLVAALDALAEHYWPDRPKRHDVKIARAGWDAITASARRQLVEAETAHSDLPAVVARVSATFARAQAWPMAARLGVWASRGLKRER